MRPIRRTLLALLAITIGLPVTVSYAAVQNRITSAVQGSRRVSLAHTVSPRAARAADLGAAPSSRKLEDLTLHFSMTGAQQTALSQLLLDQQNPTSPRYHQWLTPEQFGAQFGLSASDLVKVSSWLTSQGFTITGTARSSTFVTFSGTVGQVQEAFGTTIHSMSLNGEDHIANLTEPALPAAIAGVVLNISGLNDFRTKPRVHTRSFPASALRPENTVTTTNGVQHFIAPGDFYTIYDSKPLISNSINGSGVTIAVMGQVDLNSTALADVAAFRTASGLIANAPTIQLYGTDPGSPAGSCLTSTPAATCTVTMDDVDESLLDVEWAGAVAPSSKIIFVTSTDVIGTSLLQAIDNNIAPIMTVSYGNCESAFPQNTLQSLNASFQQANVQGITIFGPSGDDGATDCDAGVSSATQGLAVDFPASSPYVTGVGGTSFNEGTGTYWNSSNGTNAGSATSYIPEAVWNETAADLTSSTPGFGAGGGGASLLFAKPTWQSGLGVPNDFVRDVPDVSLNAAASHDGYLVCAFSSCSAGTYFPTSGNFNVFGGTSASTPSFAGILALIEQSLNGSNPPRLGNINPILYALAATSNYNSIFHDVTTGNNDSPCTAGTLNCPNGGQIGFNAGTGYDQATGLGSVDVAVLANSWKSATSTSSGTLVPTTTSITTSTTLPVSAGTTVNLAVKVASALSTNTTVPSGTIQILIDGKANGSSIALSGGAASYSLNTAALASGTHTIGATYSGDTTFSNSLGAINVDITSASSADFALTPSLASISVAGGAVSSPITFTVTPKNGFTGTVAFTSTGGISGSYVFSVNPAIVTIGSTTTSATIQYELEPAQGSLRSGQLQLESSLNQIIHKRLYGVGSGSVLACLLMLVIPRRRRWSAILPIILCLVAIGASGCSSSSSTGSTTTTTPTTPTTPTNASPNIYTVLVTATSGTITHSATIMVSVPQ